MLIRCEKCSTLYELDDKLIPAGGAPVQCSKCQFVFRAYPPAPEEAEAPPERTPPPVAPLAQPSPPVREGPAPFTPARTPPPSASPSSLDGPPADPPRSSPALRAPASAPTPDAKFTSDGRPIRKVPFPDDESSAGGAPRSPIGRGGAARAPSIPVKPRGRAPRWLLPAVLVVLLLVAAAAYAGWRVLSGRGRPHALAPARSVPAEPTAVVAAPPPAGRAVAAPGNGVAHPAAERPS